MEIRVVVHVGLWATGLGCVGKCVAGSGENCFAAVLRTLFVSPWGKGRRNVFRPLSALIPAPVRTTTRSIGELSMHVSPDSAQVLRVRGCESVEAVVSGVQD